jgi:threo-3-hydroxy-L-aspartate ammonia-lyase
VIGRAVLTVEEVEAAAARLHGVAHRTPVVTSATLDVRTGATVFLKAECYQRTGSFKFRGAYNKVASLSDGQRRAGVVAYSSGKHAQAVALAARLLGAAAVILMPEDTPAAKLDATRDYGAEVVTYDRYREDREALTRQLGADRGLTVVPPYDDPAIMAGQGTAGLELWEDAGPLDLVLVPVGGGGLAAGCATALKARQTDITVIGVEPAAGDDTLRSLRAGERVTIPIPRTIADGQQLDAPGVLTWEVNRRLLDDVVVVSDAEMVAAMRFLFDRVKLVTEPSGACAPAALLAGKVDASGRRVGVIVSGGNVGADRFARLMAAR